MSLSLVSVGQMKRLVNANKNFVLLMIKAKDTVESEDFLGFDSKLKHELDDIVNTEGLPPKRGIQHEIQFQHDAPLPNIGMHRMLVLEKT